MSRELILARAVEANLPEILWKGKRNKFRNWNNVLKLYNEKTGEAVVQIRTLQQRFKKLSSKYQARIAALGPDSRPLTEIEYIIKRISDVESSLSLESRTSEQGSSNEAVERSSQTVSANGSITTNGLVSSENDDDLESDVMNGHHSINLNPLPPIEDVQDQVSLYHQDISTKVDTLQNTVDDLRGVIETMCAKLEKIESVLDTLADKSGVPKIRITIGDEEFSN